LIDGSEITAGSTKPPVLVARLPAPPIRQASASANGQARSCFLPWSGTGPHGRVRK